MKKSILLLILLPLWMTQMTAQTLAEDPDSKKFGYKNSQGTWQIAPRYQRAFEFQGFNRKYAVVKYDNLWGCIDDKGNMVVRNIFATQEEAEAAALQMALSRNEPRQPRMGLCELLRTMEIPTPVSRRWQIPRRGADELCRREI